jgi:hypothetical protein
MSFDPSNPSLKIRESIGTLTPKVGVHLGVGLIPSHSLCIHGSVHVIPELHSWPTLFDALALVASQG